MHESVVARLPRRLPLGPALIGACAVLLVAAVVAVVLTGGRPSPAAVTTTVTACDLKQHGAAQVSFSLTNGDRATHGYRVRVSVTDGRSILGSGTSLLSHVSAGETSNARALVPVVSAGAGATCSVHAEVFDADIGHHASG